jgi:hypothetical protein
MVTRPRTLAMPFPLSPLAQGAGRRRLGYKICSGSSNSVCLIIVRGLACGDHLDCDTGHRPPGPVASFGNQNWQSNERHGENGPSPGGFGRQLRATRADCRGANQSDKRCCLPGLPGAVPRQTGRRDPDWLERFEAGLDDEGINYDQLLKSSIGSEPWVARPVSRGGAAPREALGMGAAETLGLKYKGTMMESMVRVVGGAAGPPCDPAMLVYLVCQTAAALAGAA